ncbi:hypothetical protein [Breoghania sp.]|uniref:hypothetical protein n=1 Tax=Breoghania sp. TaxID=2065378 RepID=UPI0026102A2C|nr:hypothetical protein [Breoghania sp.]MDJ0930574.1 hypothetical protein [Breoghania sp.]
MFALFLLDRVRTEVVSLAGFGAGALLDLVPVPEIFSGLSDPAFVTVVEMLLIVIAIGRTALPGRLSMLLAARRLSERQVLAVL